METAQYFVSGLLGLEWRARARLHIIPETSDLGADTLTPGDTCRKYLEDGEHGHDYGAFMLSKFRSTYLGPIKRRFRQQNPDIVFSDEEIYTMQEMCGFETLVRGSSKWCEAFTRQEWDNFEYARDVIHYYRAG